MREVALFEEAFRRSPSASATAPGRVNLIGEHTDYSGGFVLPTAIPQRTAVALARRSDRLVRGVAPTFGEGAFVLGDERRTRTWLDYVKGLTVALRARGIELTGFDFAVDSEVPIGAGLSSSAALEVAVLRAMRSELGFALGDLELALVGRAAETDFVGAPVGVMDQMASSLAEEGVALFLDTRTLAYERVPLPPELELVVIDSGIAHAHATGDYAERRRQCEAGARALGVELLRDVEDPSLADRLPPPLDRRVRHVVTENARVVRAVTLLRAGAYDDLGRLLDASHASLRDDFEVSVADVDRLVAIAQGDPAVLGARMTGGGFGGAIVALTLRGQGTGAAGRVVRAYGPRGRVLLPREEER